MTKICLTDSTPDNKLLCKFDKIVEDGTYTIKIL
jgi:hypothetical protein